jgi:cold shock CspA family protein/ribosome-associated translation inhibitor RaiA
MKIPLQVTFRNMEPSPIVEEWIRAEAEKVDTFYNQIMACRVAVEIPHRHRTKGILYHIRIDLTVPGGELVIKRQPNPRNQARQAGRIEMTKSLEMESPHKDLRLAIDDAFRAAGRRLQDYARRQSGFVKTHELPLKARVSKLLPDEGYGFLATEDGGEIYFHKQSVLNHGFARLQVGTAVTFVEEQGEKGPQASTVQILGKPRSTYLVERTSPGKLGAVPMP